MGKIIFGNHSSVIVPLSARENIRKFYCGVIDGKMLREDPEKDVIRFGENFYIVFLYGDVPDASEFLRTARSVWLEIKSDNVEATSRKILESGFVTKLDMPDPHLYFQAPGGQCWRLVGISEDLSFYEGAGKGPNVGKIKEALNKMPSLNYITANYTVSIETGKPPADIFNHIVNNVAKWWPEEVEGKCNELNSEFIFRTGETHFSKNKVDEFVPNEKVVWLVTESIRKTDNFDWTGTRMIFELTPNGDQTTLKFTIDGPILENEYDRLIQLCDMVIKEKLFNLITNGN